MKPEHHKAIGNMVLNADNLRLGMQFDSIERDQWAKLIFSDDFLDGFLAAAIAGSSENIRNIRTVLYHLTDEYDKKSLIKTTISHLLKNENNSNRTADVIEALMCSINEIERGELATSQLVDIYHTAKGRNSPISLEIEKWIDPVKQKELKLLAEAESDDSSLEEEAERKLEPVEIDFAKDNGFTRSGSTKSNLYDPSLDETDEEEIFRKTEFTKNSSGQKPLKFSQLSPASSFEKSGSKES